MTTNARKILLAFSSFPGKELLKEVFAQMNPKIRLDLVANEVDMMQYLSRTGTRGLPDLILFESPPLRPNIGGLVDSLRKEATYSAIPLIFLCPPADAQTLRKWMQSGSAHFFPLPSKPSECKLYVRQMLDLCKDFTTSNDSLPEAESFRRPPYKFA
ncbi:MAG TPA: hypothetical protein VGM89_19995 [Puia sp.]|jgi:hypothetical protein